MPATGGLEWNETTPNSLGSSADMLGYIKHGPRHITRDKEEKIPKILAISRADLNAQVRRANLAWQAGGAGQAGPPGAVRREASGVTATEQTTDVGSWTVTVSTIALICQGL